jgi:hypothetical protein
LVRTNLAGTSKWGTLQTNARNAVLLQCVLELIVTSNIVTNSLILSTLMCLCQTNEDRLLVAFYNYFEFGMMDKVHKPSIMKKVTIAESAVGSQDLMGT